MVYRKRNYKAKAKKVYKKKSNTGLLALQRKVRMLEMRTKPEYKVIDVDSSANITDLGTQTEYLTPIGTGTLQTNRIGKRIYISSLYVRGSININNSASATSVRMVIIKQIGDDNITPIWSDVFTSLDTDAIRKINLQEVFNWKVIYDKTIFLSKNGTMIKPVNCYLKNVGSCAFSGDTNSQTDAGPGSLWMILLSSEGTNFPAANFLTRVRYIDS